MLVNLNDILPRAAREHYAVGLFNTVNLEMAKGVLAAAEEMRSPVIIGTAEILLPYAELEELAYFLVPMARKAKVPVVLHYDHGLTGERVHQAMELGFTSVMYDCSTLDFDGNCREVAALTREAHSRGITVEAELGHVGANAGTDESDGADDSIYTKPEEARRFWEATGVDALAVAIGTAHGAYRAKPRLDFDRLATYITDHAILHSAEISIGTLNDLNDLNEEDTNEALIEAKSEIEQVYDHSRINLSNIL